MEKDEVSGIDTTQQEHPAGDAEKDAEFHIPEMTMDSTSITEISVMANEEYSQQIIENTMNGINLEQLQQLKTDNLDNFRDEAKKQVCQICQGIEALTTHTDMFVVRFHLPMGTILNEVEDSYEKKSDYMKWVRANFDMRHLRNFQQAKQLALMKDFAERYSGVGKNRLLQIDHLRRDLKLKTCDEVIAGHVLPDITTDPGGEEMKLRLDTVVTLQRLKKEGIDFAEYDQAALIALFNKGAITVKAAKDIKTWLDEQEVGRRTELFDALVMDKMKYPIEREKKASPKDSIEKVLVSLIKACKAENFDDIDWIEEHRQLIETKWIEEAQTLLNQLKAKLESNRSIGEITDTSINTNR